MAEGRTLATFDIVPSEDDITFHDNATKALQTQTEEQHRHRFPSAEGRSARCLRQHRQHRRHGGSIFSVKPISGVIRPCIPSVLPKENGGFGILLDVGANADCKPDVLCQFGLLGSLLAESVYGIPNPKVALLNIGRRTRRATWSP